MTSFGERLQVAVDAHGPLCVGIDPHSVLLRAWGLPESPEGVRSFGLAVVEAAAGRLAVVKPQVAFFERFGAAGIAVLEEIIRVARATGLLVIADAKRGDIGSTAEAYGAAWLAAGAPLRSDALTLAPYVGLGALEAVIDIGRTAGNGVFVLAATSNPEGRELQASLDGTGETVAGRIAQDAAARNASAAGWGDIGLVIGATQPLAVTGIDPTRLARTPILAPGFGAQGACLGELGALFGAAADTVIPSVSRSVLGAGRDGLVAAIESHRTELTR